MGQFTWTAEIDAVVAKLASEGQSARQIAEAIGTTRNAVFGRSHRKGIQLDKTKSVKLRSEAKKAEAAKKPARITTITLPKVAKLPVFKTVVIETPPKVFEPTTFGVSFADLGPRSCRFALGKMKDRPDLFCGHETSMPGSAWCEWHRSVVYRPVPTKKPDARPFRFVAAKVAAQ